MSTQIWTIVLIKRGTGAWQRRVILRLVLLVESALIPTAPDSLLTGWYCGLRDFRFIAGVREDVDEQERYVFPQERNIASCHLSSVLVLFPVCDSLDVVGKRRICTFCGVLLCLLCNLNLFCLSCA